MRYICHLAHLLLPALIQGHKHQNPDGVIGNHMKQARGNLLTVHLNEQDSEIKPRQQPLITTVPLCDLYDGYFYQTPRNYTWQLQCSTNYEGNVIAQVNVANYSACISACIDYNRATSPGSCLAITFNGPNDGAPGLCTEYSQVMTVALAYEEGNVQDSALLVMGPDGTQYATPQPDPSFSGAPSQGPTLDPVLLTTSSDAPQVSTVFSTSFVYVTSCAPDITNCPTLTQTMTYSSVYTMSTSSPLVSVSTPTSTAISISDGGERPLSSSTITDDVASTSTSSEQSTITSLVPITEYLVQVVEVCSGSSTSCSQYTETSSRIEYRTEISCSPDPCMGTMMMTTATAQFEDTCFLS